MPLLVVYAIMKYISEYLNACITERMNTLPWIISASSNDVERTRPCFQSDVSLTPDSYTLNFFVFEKMCQITRFVVYQQLNRNGFGLSTAKTE